jgi:hypothetical protein
VSHFCICACVNGHPGHSWRRSADFFSPLSRARLYLKSQENVLGRSRSWPPSFAFLAFASPTPLTPTFVRQLSSNSLIPTHTPPRPPTPDPLHKPHTATTTYQPIIRTPLRLYKRTSTFHSLVGMTSQTRAETY